MSRIRADQITNKAASGAVNITHGAEVTGVITATSFDGPATSASSLTNTASINSTGISTFASGNYTGNVTVGGNVDVTGNMSVTGTLTFEDLTNQDVIGLSTFRSGVDINSGGLDITAGGIDVTAGGINVVAGITTVGGGASVTGTYKSNITTVSGTTIDCSQGNYFKKTITGATEFGFSNVPTGCVYIMTLEVTCNGSAAITWTGTAVKWPADTAPTLTDGKTQLFTLVTDDGGARWRANSSVDYVN